MRIPRAILVATVFGLSAACGNGPATPTPAGGSIRPSGYVPQITGVVTGIDGSPVANATAQLRWSSRSRALTLATAQSDQAGRFAIPTLGVDCHTDSPLTSVTVGRVGYRSHYAPGPACSTSVSAPAWDIGTVRLVEDLWVALDHPVQTLLSNHDSDLGLEPDNGYACGPCKLVELVVRPGQSVEVIIEWTTADRLWAGVEADTTGFGYTTTAAEYQASPGQRSLTVPIPSAWSQYPDAVWVKVGLPQGSRSAGGLAAPLTLRISMR